jgi:hypothetical protein
MRAACNAATLPYPRSFREPNSNNEEGKMGYSKGRESRRIRAWLCVAAACLVGMSHAALAAVTFTTSTVPDYVAGLPPSGGDVLQPNGAVIADFDGDGYPDLVVIDSNGYVNCCGSNTNYPTIVFFKGGPLGTFAPTSGQNIFTPLLDHSVPSPAAIAAGDINGDGRLDLVIGSADDSAPGPYVLFGNGNGTFTLQQILNAPGSNEGIEKLYLKDINHDGKLDIVATYEKSNVWDVPHPWRTGVITYVNQGNGTFDDYTDLGGGDVSWGAKTLALAEFGGDGNADAVIIDTPGDSQAIHGMLFFKGNGDGTFQDWVNLFDLDQLTAAGVQGTEMDGVASDLDKDGCNDYVFATDAGVYWSRGHCNDTFDLPQKIGSLPSKAGSNAGSRIVIGDFDGDGRKDVAFSGMIFLHQSNGTWLANGPTVCQPDSNNFCQVTWFAGKDVNGDGRTDLVGSAADGNHVTIWLTAAGPATHAIIVTGDNQSATFNTAFPAALKVRVLDGANNPVSGVQVTYVPPGGFGTSASIPGGNGFTDVQGYFAAPATANNTIGCYEVTAKFGVAIPDLTFDLCNTGLDSIATVSGTPQTTQVSTVFAAPIRVRVTNGGSGVAGVAVKFAPPAGFASALVSANPAGPWSGTVNVSTDASGYAQAYAQANPAAGTYVIAATASGTNGTGAFTMTNTAPASAAAALVVDILSSPQSTLIRKGFLNPIKVQVVDQANAPVTGVTLRFAQPGDPASAPGALLSASNTACSSGTAGPVDVAVDASGYAQAYACANAYVGSYPLSVSVIANGTVTPATVQLRNYAPPPATIAAASGTPQSTSVNASFPALLSVRLLDTEGLPVPGAKVFFGAPTSGPSAALSSVVVFTDQNGIASVLAQANGLAGGYQVGALARNEGFIVVPFDLTNTVAPLPDNPQPVPALDGRGLALLGLLIAAGGAWGWRTRQRA